LKTAMQETSLMAFWNEIFPTLAPRHKEIVKIFRENYSMTFTNNELLDQIRLYDPVREINSITPRVYELRGKGKNNPFTLWPFLIKSEVRKCRITERTAIAWQLNHK